MATGGMARNEINVRAEARNRKGRERPWEKERQARRGRQTRSSRGKRRGRAKGRRDEGERMFGEEGAERGKEGENKTGEVHLEANMEEVGKQRETPSSGGQP